MYTDIIRIISEFGWVGFLLVVFLIILIKYINKNFDNVFTKNSKSINDISLNNTNDLKYHQFFSNAQYRLMVEIPNLEIDNTRPVRQRIFRDLLYIKIKSFYDGFQAITEIDMSNWSSEQWIFEMNQHIRSILNEYELKCRQRGIPDEVLIKFSRWNCTSMDVLYEYITGLGNSKIYDNNISRTNTLMFIMNLLLVTLIADAERTLKDLNGEISGKLYKNSIIED